MGIIVKFILRSIFEKKFRAFIIVFSIAISSALFFACIGLSGTMSSMYETQIRMQTGKADLVIQADRDSPSSTFKIRTDSAEGVSFTAGEVLTAGTYRLSEDDALKNKTESETLIIRGFKEDELQKLNPVNFSQKAVGKPFEGNCIVLSQVFADKYGFKVGDRIDVEINGRVKILTVWGISRPTGLFQHNPQSDSMTSLMPMETLASFLNIKGRVLRAYVVLQDDADIQSVKDTLAKMYPRYSVSELFSADELNQYMQFIVVPLFLMTSMVLFISIFIIYSTFKVITAERLPVIGTFRSIGATKKMTDTVLIGESLTYGLLGGIFGDVMGIGILYLIAKIMAADPYSGKMNVSMEFGLRHLLAAFLVALVVALVSSWLPISKTSRIPIKDLVLNNFHMETKNKKWKKYAGISMLIISVLLPKVAPESLALAVNSLSLLSAIAAVIMCVPFITVYFLKVFERIYGYTFGNEGILAVKNLSGNKNILNNISLLAIGISSILMINTISSSVGIEVLNAYRDWNFDIMVSINAADRNAEQILRSTEGISSTYGAFETWDGVKVADSDYTIRYLQGIDIDKYRDFVFFHLEGSKDYDRVFRELDESRSIMVANMARERLGLKEGDKLTLETKSGNKDYRVIGFYNSIMGNGSNAVISQKFYKVDMEEPYYGSFFVKTSKNPDEVLSAIKDKFMRRGVWGDTIDSMERKNYESNNQFMIILQAFSVLAMLIGIFGVFNNYMISFLDRKRSLAMMRSVGLSKRQTIKMILIEAMTGGCIGGIVGIISGTLMLCAVPDLMQSIDVPLKIHYSLSFFVSALVGGVIIAVLASVSPALKTSRLNVIEAIKYE
ncbi:MAG: FtsX-like permease family protein [Sedimentibacter sp.]|uniref:ABC transporter permease n=1 Tax=Sedimentibacter sp. TaxID=1960295 RepID=UPI003158DA53